jgi:hypothetical protein
MDTAGIADFLKRLRDNSFRTAAQPLSAISEIFPISSPQQLTMHLPARPRGSPRLHRRTPAAHCAGAPMKSVAACEFSPESCAHVFRPCQQSDSLWHSALFHLMLNFTRRAETERGISRRLIALAAALHPRGYPSRAINQKSAACWFSFYAYCFLSCE